MEPDDNDWVECILVSQISFYLILVISYVIRRLYRGSNRGNPQKCKDKDFLYNVDCPICFNVLTMPIKADCGHGYCMDCLYQYWEKPSWNNCCPLCRLPINDLILLENSKYNYIDSTRRILQKKIWKMLSYSYILRLNHFIQIQTVRHIILCMIYLTIWTWIVANARNILHLFSQMYNLFYEQNQPSDNHSEIRI